LTDLNSCVPRLLHLRLYGTPLNFHPFITHVLVFEFCWDTISICALPIRRRSVVHLSYMKDGFSSCFSVLSKYVFFRHLPNTCLLALVWDYRACKSMLLHYQLICVESHFFYQVVRLNNMPHSTNLIISQAVGIL
jgi:hypothetical protein